MKYEYPLLEGFSKTFHKVFHSLLWSLYIIRKRNDDKWNSIYDYTVRENIKNVITNVDWHTEEKNEKKSVYIRYI